ncbi:PREDICTED: uncharacterized protein LOC105824361 [Propithecus coquereli]|uniref:uncharacterized protein LOC105824361 n=1 Tax=Propithecus coquereli TaxID=379532 RepID=UPI00063F44CB|nr:PREDICTED: uncharacterized protein LOC105824361 [Propithecus coquereli]
MLTGTCFITPNPKNPWPQPPAAKALTGTEPLIHIPHSNRAVTVAATFLYYVEKRPVRESRSQAANVSVTWEWVLDGREKLEVGCLSATLLTRVHPLPLSMPCLEHWVLFTMLDASSAAPHLSLLPSQLVSLTTSVVGGGQMLMLEADLEKETHRQGGWDRAWYPGAGIWLAVWPSSEEVAEPRGEGCCSPGLSQGPNPRAGCAWKQELLWKPSFSLQVPSPPSSSLQRGSLTAQNPPYCMGLADHTDDPDPKSRGSADWGPTGTALWPQPPGLREDTLALPGAVVTGWVPEPAAGAGLHLQVWFKRVRKPLHLRFHWPFEISSLNITSEDQGGNTRIKTIPVFCLQPHHFLLQAQLQLQGLSQPCLPDSITNSTGVPRFTGN